MECRPAKASKQPVGTRWTETFGCRGLPLARSLSVVLSPCESLSLYFATAVVRRFDTLSRSVSLSFSSSCNSVNGRFV